MGSEFDFEKQHRIAREIVETIVLAVLMFLVIHLAFQNFIVDGMSMEPNLHNQEWVMVDKVSYLLRPPARGDVVVFVAPPQPTLNYVKRIVGLPGDVITIQGTKVTVNGKTLNDPFVDPRLQGNQYPSFTNLVVPPNTYFVLGDNRYGSFDSRAWGCVPKANLIGRAVLVYWPLGRDNYGLIPNVASDFSGIPQPPPVADPRICHISSGNGNDFALARPQSVTRTFDMNTIFLLLLPGVFAVCMRKPQLKRKK
jgi:signal peptidase I